MYAPSDFNPPTAPPPAGTSKERVIGLVALIVLLFACLFFSLSADADVFNPLNTARPITQTWRATLHGTPNQTFPTRPPRSTQTPRFGNSAAENLGTPYPRQGNTTP